MLHALQVLAAHGPPGAWIGAGFLRNAVWDAAHGRAPDPGTLADLDVVYHDPTNADPARDAAIEGELRRVLPLPWQVANQARMHCRNGHAPYGGLAEALARWPETATAIAARWDGVGVAVLAPHGVADLLCLVLRPTPGTPPEVVRTRMIAKRWIDRWPQLRLQGALTQGARSAM